jgi:hypothetical protein
MTSTTVSAQTEKALRDAMERLLAGRPERSDGKLTKNNLWREAGVSRATMDRATKILAEWNARTSPAASLARQRDLELTELRKSNEDRRKLQHQLDAAATVIATLLAENATLREQAARQSAVLIPLNRNRDRTLPP